MAASNTWYMNMGFIQMAWSPSPVGGVIPICLETRASAWAYAFANEALTIATARSFEDGSV
jgi:hypothetical protein